jgi:hypothetical protein
MNTIFLYIYISNKMENSKEHKENEMKKRYTVINMDPTLIFPDAFSLGTLLPDDEFYNLLYPPTLDCQRQITQPKFLRS